MAGIFGSMFPNGFMPAVRNNSDVLMRTGIGLISGRTGPEQAAMGGQAFLDARQGNRTLQYLQKNFPELAPYVQAGVPAGELLKMAAGQKLQAQMPGKATAEIQNFEYGQQNPAFAQWQKERAYTRGAELGLSPVYGVDENNNVVIGQLSKTGGVTWDGEPSGVVTPVSPEQLSQMKSRGTVTGKAQGEAAFSVPSMQQMAAQIEFQVNDLKNDPFLDNVIGPIDSRRPHISGESARAQAKIDQLQGGAFLQARQLLKGGGQITDYEGARAEAAFARLNQAQDEASFKAALDEFVYWTKEGLRKLEAQAAGGSYTPQTPSSGGTSSAPDPLGLR